MSITLIVAITLNHEIPGQIRVTLDPSNPWTSGHTGNDSARMMMTGLVYIQSSPDHLADKS